MTKRLGLVKRNIGELWLPYRWNYPNRFKQQWFCLLNYNAVPPSKSKFCLENMKKKKSFTIRDIAENAGVSPATVSLVLNGKGEISGETRARVLE